MSLVECQKSVNGKFLDAACFNHMITQPDFLQGQSCVLTIIKVKLNFIYKYFNVVLLVYVFNTTCNNFIIAISLHIDRLHYSYQLHLIYFSWSNLEIHLESPSEAITFSQSNIGANY